MFTRYPKAILTVTLAVAISMFAGAAKEGEAPFLTKPYLGLGDNPTPSRNERLALIWHAADQDQEWQVEYRVGSSTRKANPKFMRVAAKGVAPFRVYEAPLERLTPGGEFTYKVTLAGATVFESRGKARKGANEPTRTVIFGDCAQGTEGQRAIAYQTAQLKPDYVFIPGDIVYGRGRISEYREKYFPIYNADEAALGVGAPLIRSTLFISVPGNHDIGTPVDISSDALGYFYFWRQPLNGPTAAPGDTGAPILKGDDADRDQFLKTAGPLFPRMANFSFDYGMVHWTVIDSNAYVDWTDEKLRDWVRKDLAAAKNAKWRVVALHHPPYNSSKNHFNDQRARVLSNLFEEGNVSVVLAGHVHNYQRTYPLKFQVAGGIKPLGKETKVAGEFTFDKNFDGVNITRPRGVVYLVTGAGGASLYNPDQTDNPKSWEPFTAVFKSNVHSLTVMDATADALSFQQISATGTRLDDFRITR
ncbi:MAG: metallophosphoesterase [Bryobacteraceae bacterium]|nr:metallophosphoesterase [Bryobacteraceae bacterium]